jgi:hypothetical protein
MEEELKKLWGRVVALETHVGKLTSKLVEHGIHVPAEEPEPEAAPAEQQ